MREHVEGIRVPDLDSSPPRNLLDIGPAHALHRLLLVVEVGAARENSESERQRKAKLVQRKDAPGMEKFRAQPTAALPRGGPLASSTPSESAPKVG